MKQKEIDLDSIGQEIPQTIPDFPLSCYYSEFTRDTYDLIDWHWHTELQLCLTLRGTVVWGTESYTDLVQAGKGIFINSQRVHTAKPLGDGAAFFCMDIPPDLLCPDKNSRLYEVSMRPVLEEADLDRKVIDGQTIQERELLARLSRAASVFDAKGYGYEFDLMSEVFRIWRVLRSWLEPNIQNIRGGGDDRFRKILAYLQKNYAEAISLDEIAAHIGLSRSECCRYFKRIAGQTLFVYLRQYRLHKSFNWLTETDRPISQVAQICGFPCQSYYTKEFRRLTGITPRQYRLQNQKSRNPSINA